MQPTHAHGLLEWAVPARSHLLHFCLRECVLHARSIPQPIFDVSPIENGTLGELLLLLLIEGSGNDRECRFIVAIHVNIANVMSMCLLTSNKQLYYCSSTRKHNIASVMHILFVFLVHADARSGRQCGMPCSLRHALPSRAVSITIPKELQF